MLKLERFQVICPACGEQVEAVARDGQVKGYCAVARQYVDFLIETQRVGTGNHPPEIAALKKRWQDPEYRAKQIAAQKKRWQDPEYRASLLAAQKKRWQDPDYRAKQIAAQKKRWQDPEYRAKQIATHIGRETAAETRAKISVALTRWHNRVKSND